MTGFVTSRRLEESWLSKLDRWLISREAVKTHMGRALSAKETDLRARQEQAKAEIPWQEQHEGGSSGLESLQDKYATTRGDH